MILVLKIVLINIELDGGIVIVIVLILMVNIWMDIIYRGE